MALACGPVKRLMPPGWAGPPRLATAKNSRPRVLPSQTLASAGAEASVLLSEARADKVRRIELALIVGAGRLAAQQRQRTAGIRHIADTGIDGALANGVFGAERLAIAPTVLRNATRQMPVAVQPPVRVKAAIFSRHGTAAGEVAGVGKTGLGLFVIDAQIAAKPLREVCLLYTSPSPRD